MVRSKLIVSLKGVLCWLPLLGVVAGCRSYTERVADYRAAYSVGDVTTAGQIISEMVQEEATDDGESEALLVLLEAGSLFRTAGRLEQSQTCFNRAEHIYDRWQQRARFSVSREGVSLFTNPATLPYRGAGADVVMLNTYQALNTLERGDIAGARQPLVRLLNHQKEVVADNAERIAKTKAACEKSEYQTAIRNTTQHATTQSASNAMLAALPDTRGYELYVNPFSTYLYAFYHLYAGVDAADREMGRHSMLRALSMAPNNAAVQFDAALAERGATLPDGVYLFHETGLAPYREEFKLTLPIWAGDTISLITFAVPTLKEDANAAAFATLQGGAQTATAQLVCDMDAVITQEYKNDYPGILTRAIASATAKAVAAYTANYAAQQSGDGLVQLGTLLSTFFYQVATNVADTRSWVSLPKRIGLARIDYPADHVVKVQWSGATIAPITLPKRGVWVVCMRTQHQGCAPSVRVFRIR